MEKTSLMVHVDAVLAVSERFSKEMTEAIKAGEEERFNRLLSDLQAEMGNVVGNSEIGHGNPFREAGAAEETRFYGSVVRVHQKYGEFVSFVHRVLNDGCLLQLSHPHADDRRASIRFRSDEVTPLVLVDWQKQTLEQ